MSHKPVRCRLCGATRIRCVGSVPDSDYFAGRVLPDPIAGGHLWSCDTCLSMFRHPVLPNSAYLQLYAEGVADEWGADDGRRDLEIIRHIITRNAAHGSVLDVGCGAGGFLLTLPADIQRYGVEPSVAAASAAEAAGVQVLATTLEDLSADKHFDVITMIDVIEHVADPKELLDQALTHLASGGVLIIATGDAGNGSWRRIFRSRFWYSSFPEHITFPSLRYFDMWHEGRGLQAPTSVKFKYRNLPAWKTALYLSTQIIYLASPSLLNRIARCSAWLRRMPLPRRQLYSPGAPGVFADHQVVTIHRLQ